MDDDLLEKYIKQHYDNYKNSILELIDNNTSVLFDDILLLIKKPPLDSMDSIRNRFLEIAKKYGIILNTDELNNFLDSYRNCLMLDFDRIKSIRTQSLKSVVSKFASDQIIVFFKKDFIPINKKLRSFLKNQVISSFDNCFNKYHNKLFSSNDDISSDLFFKEVLKFIKGNYQRQLLDSFDIKILVKDTTLMNAVKEQNDHYLFTLNNSRLLNL